MTKLPNSTSPDLNQLGRIDRNWTIGVYSAKVSIRVNTSRNYGGKKLTGDVECASDAVEVKEKDCGQVESHKYTDCEDCEDSYRGYS